MKSVLSPGDALLEISRLSWIMFGRSPGIADALTGMSVPSDAAVGPPNEYVNVGSRPSPWMQIDDVDVPEAGRVTVIGAAPIVQLPPLSAPMKFTLIGELDAAVEGSAATTLIELIVCCAELSFNPEAEISIGTTTKGTGLESAPLGFWIWIVNVPAEARSDGLSGVAHEFAVGHVVARALPLIKMIDADAPLPATKCSPSSSRGNPSTAPALTLDGKIVSIVAPLVIATVAANACGGVEASVAITEIAFGDGALDGAVKTPLEFMLPHVAPVHPAPVTADATVHETGTPTPVGACTKNCCLLGAPPVAATNAYSGAIASAEPVAPEEITIVAVAFFVGSATLVASTITGFCDGGVAGAMYRTLPANPLGGAEQGLVPDWQSSPTDELPFVIPFTVQVTPRFVDPKTVGVSVTLPNSATVAVAGATLTDTLLTRVIDAAALALPDVAWTVSADGDGMLAGAVKVAALDPVATIVPTALLPPGIPFTSHTIEAFCVTQSEAANDCVAPRTTLAEAGVIEFVAPHEIVTAAFAETDGSATLATVIVTGSCNGNSDGAAYTAVVAPFVEIVPTDVLPPTKPLTLHVNCCATPPDPETVAVKSCEPFVGTVVDEGASVRDIDGAKLTTAEALAVASATLTAVAVTLEFGVVAGALYSPSDEIVPVMVFPPVTPFTSQVTAEFFVPVTIAVNCWVAPAERETLFGYTVTTTAPGFVTVCNPPLHELNAITIAAIVAATVADLARAPRRNREPNSAARVSPRTIGDGASNMSAVAVSHDMCHREAMCDSLRN